MLEIPKPKTSDLIDEREYRKRNMKFIRKNAKIIQDIMNLYTNNKISWGTIVEENARKYSDKVAIKFEDITITYKEFNEWVNRYAHYFISLGLKKGDVVEIFMTNRPEYLIIFTAIGKIGAISSLINTDLREKSLEHCLKLTPGKIIIIDENCYDQFNVVKTALNLAEEQKLCYLSDKGTILCPEGLIDLLQVVKDFPIYDPPTTIDVQTFDNIAYIFTSGTTGFPKAAKIRHYNIVAVSWVYGIMVGELTPEDTNYISLPLFHGTGLFAGWAAAFGSGAAIAIGRKFSASCFWDDIRKYNATCFAYVGEICRYLMNQPSKPDDSNNSVRVVIGNGLRPEIWMDFKKRFNIPRIGEFYSAIDGNGIFANILNFDCTVGGCASSYAIVKYDFNEDKPIRDDDGFMQKVGLGETGLLLFENAGILKFQGYTDKKASESKVLHNIFKEGDEWFNTGDLLRDLGNKHAQFIDRLGDSFRWKGHNVSTTEVEEVLNIFDQVLLSSVYGVQITGTDGRAGMTAIVSEIPVEDFKLNMLADSFRKNLPPYAIPIFLRFKSKLSTTATFKLKKVKLKEEGFDLEKVEDPLYIMLPHESEYRPLTKEIYENIQNGQYKF
jgi:citronellyl-CoA synthetase